MLFLKTRHIVHPYVTRSFQMELWCHSFHNYTGIKIYAKIADKVPHDLTPTSGEMVYIQFQMILSISDFIEQNLVQLMMWNSSWSFFLNQYYLIFVFLLLVFNKKPSEWSNIVLILTIWFFTWAFLSNWIIIYIS